MFFFFTWYSLISDFSNPGMNRVTDFLAVSNVTGGVKLTVPERTSLTLEFAWSSRILSQSRPFLVNGTDAEAKGSGTNSSRVILFDSEEDIAKAAEA